MDVLPVPAKYMAAARHKGTLLQDHNNFIISLGRSRTSLSGCAARKPAMPNGCRVTATVSIKSTEVDENDDGAGDEIIAIRGDRNHDSDLMAEAAKLRMG